MRFILSAVCMALICCILGGCQQGSMQKNERGAGEAVGVSDTGGMTERGVFEVGLRNQDDFQTEHAQEAIPYRSSEYCDVHYRVLNLNQESDRGERYWLLRFDLLIFNKTHQEMCDFTMNVHFPESLQSVLANSRWYTEPVRLGPFSETDYSHGVEYRWEALVDLPTLGILGDVSLDDFYDVLIDIAWKGGGEILRVSGDSELTDDWILKEDKAAARLSQEDVACMLEEGIRQRKKWFGE